ncbi:Ammonium transporter 3 member 1 [Sesamum angolense]|uniref:Ammonium transporter 3 member 1 n=1 Tax=Sesamum angolense TaxID=2727404 RepID=A0AAE2C338_9LAMI|nr:Ammonium transporter 3 member 1 [Sesamum angolense]
MGLLSGSIPWFTMMVLHKKSRLLKQVDDTMAPTPSPESSAAPGLFTNAKTQPPLLPRRHLAALYWLGLRLPRWQNWRRVQADGDSDSGSCVHHRAERYRDELDLSVDQASGPAEDVGGRAQRRDDAVHGREAYALWGDGEKFEKSVHNSVYGVEDVELKERERASLLFEDVVF